MRHKTSEQPMTSGSKQLIALDIAIYNSTGDPDAAVRQGLVNMGFDEDVEYEWVTTETYQLITHEVPPSSEALSCDDCHDSNERIDLRTFGYAIKDSESVICRQCHGSERSGFSSVHSRHVGRYSYDCSWCHTFSRPERDKQKLGE